MMVIDHLRREKSPQYVARLARTSKAFYKTVNQFLYQTAKLVKRQNGLQFAALMERRPDLKALVTEVQHHADNGFHNFTFCSDGFYKELATFPNLHTLVMRPRPENERTSRLERWEDLLQSTCTFIHEMDWEEEVVESMARFFDEDTGEQEREPARDPFNIDEALLEPHIPVDQEDLVARARFCGGYLSENSLPALHTCQSLFLSCNYPSNKSSQQ